MFAQPAALLLFVSEKLSDREPFEWFLEFAFVRRNHTDRKSTRLNSSHSQISYAVFCLKKKKNTDKDVAHQEVEHSVWMQVEAGRELNGASIAGSTLLRACRAAGSAQERGYHAYVLSVG